MTIKVVQTKDYKIERFPTCWSEMTWGVKMVGDPGFEEKVRFQQNSEKRWFYLKKWHNQKNKDKKGNEYSGINQLIEEKLEKPKRYLREKIRGLIPKT